MEVPSYASVISDLKGLRPRIAKRLAEAERLRADRGAAYLTGARFAGLEELLSYLDAAVVAFSSDERLARIAFLVERATADFETAIEATLSGYQGVAADSMRDVMEIEYLFLDFVATPDHLDEWLGADRRLLLSKFGPGRIRDRLKSAGIPPFANEGWEAVDYQAHSAALHVTPQRSLVGARGIEQSSPVPWLADAGFIEMFEHGLRICTSIEALRVSRATASDQLERLGSLEKFFEARDRTREMLVMIVAAIEGPRVLRERLGREPSQADFLGYVADQIEEKSPRR